MKQLTNVNFAANTPPSKGVSLGPIMRASHVKKSDSEIGPSEREHACVCVCVQEEVEGRVGGVTVFS